MQWIHHPSEVWHAASLQLSSNRSFAKSSGSAEVADVPAAAGALLTRLGFGLAGAEPGHGEVPHAGLMLDFAARMTDVFEIASPDAPGLQFLAGMTSASRHLTSPGATGPLSVGGCGASFRSAFFACIGEAIERTAQCRPAHAIATQSFPSALERQSDGFKEVVALLGPRLGADAEIAWLQARNLTTGAETLVPAELCIRSADLETVAPATSLSLGCACAPTLEQAMLAGILEWVERDATALWWLAGHSPRHIALETLEEAGVLSTIVQLRQGQATRRSWLLDITADLGIPCVASVSFDLGGRGFVHGSAARLKLADAARAAFVEMCQMEVACHLIAAKGGAGSPRLSAAERRHQQRFEAITAEALPILRPLLAPATTITAEPRPTGLHAVVEELGRSGFECLAVDLTLPELGMPVVKMIAPGLQPMPSSVRSPRLRQAIAMNEDYRPSDIPLF